MEGEECPALYFDPLIVIGGDREVEDPVVPNYCTRCDQHHYLPGKEYTYLILKPLGEEASRGNLEPLSKELKALRYNLLSSELYRHFSRTYKDRENGRVNMNALKVGCVAEKALMFLFAEQNLVSQQQMICLVDTLKLDVKYLAKSLADNGRPVEFTMELF